MISNCILSPCFSLLALFFVIGRPLNAADFFVRARASGADNGADWIDAFSELDQISWSRVHPGDTIWIAGGTYATSLAPVASGISGNPIVVRRVMAKDTGPAAAVGWSPSFDSQVQIVTNRGIKWASGISGTGSFVTIDGRTDSGIRCVATDSEVGSGVYMNTGNAGVILQDIEMVGPAGSAPYNYHGDGSALYVNAAAGLGRVHDLTVRFCRMHGAVNAVKLSADSTTLEHCQFYDNCALNSATYHENIISAFQNTGSTVFRYNEIYNWDNEGIMLWGASVQGPWEIYDNIWHDRANGSYSRVLESQDAANGPIYFFNNTVVNAWLGVRVANGGSFAAGSKGRNNLYWKVQGLALGLPDNDYDFSDDPITSHEIHGIGIGILPFVDYKGRDYRIVATVGSAYPRSKGTTLAPRFGTDINGVARTYWDMGAFAFAAGQNSPSTTTEQPVRSQHSSL